MRQHPSMPTRAFTLLEMLCATGLITLLLGLLLDALQRIDVLNGAMALTERCVSQ